MNNESKLILSDEEQLLVNNTQWILTKRIIIEKAMLLFGSMSQHMQAVIEKESWLPEPVVRSSPKITRGENYLQLPYVMLDYPRCFDADNIFAVRTMFWWGNFFSITLHLSGNYKKQFQQNILNNLFSTKQGFFICVHENQWHHHFETGNYIPVDQLSGNELNAIIAAKPFIKLAVRFPLHEWDHVITKLDGSFAEIVKMLKDQLPRR